MARAARSTQDRGGTNMAAQDNPFYVAPANPLQALMMGVQGYDRGRKAATDEEIRIGRGEAMQALQSGGDMRGALARLIGVGDIPGANAIANFGNQTADQAYKTGMLEVARQNASRQEVPPQLKLLQATGINPASPEGKKALFPRTDTPISATDKKAIFEAEDALPQLQGTKDALNRAMELNSKTFKGAGAGVRAFIGSKLPDMMVPDVIADKRTADATAEWQNIMGPEALNQMANTLKGATTDFELRKFMELLADPSTPPDVRAGVIKRMQVLTDRKLELANARIKDLRGGEYFRPGGGQAAPTTSAPVNTKTINGKTYYQVGDKWYEK